MSSNPSFSDRVSKSAELLSVDPKDLAETLKKSGIEETPVGLALLNATTTTLEDIGSIIQEGYPAAKKLQIKAVSAILKGDDPLSQPPVPRQVEALKTEAQTLAEVLKANRPIEQWGDKELLERYAVDREYEVEQELHKRAKFQPFLLIAPGTHEPGKEVIDISASLDLLKSARKRTNPTMIPNGGTVVPVYRITELNLQDRIIDLCPMCGAPLSRGYCESCQVNFSGVGEDERAYVALIAKSDKFELNSFSDRKAVHASAVKGIDDLKVTWPSLMKTFDELKLTNSLPKIRIIENRPGTQVADPFFHDGNRAFGNRKF